MNTWSLNLRIILWSAWQLVCYKRFSVLAWLGHSQVIVMIPMFSQKYLNSFLSQILTVKQDIFQRENILFPQLVLWQSERESLFLKNVSVFNTNFWDRIFKREDCFFLSVSQTKNFFYISFCKGRQLTIRTFKKNWIFNWIQVHAVRMYFHIYMTKA